jgi:hypothetical protein
VLLGSSSQQSLLSFCIFDKIVGGMSFQAACAGHVCSCETHCESAK